MLFSHGFDFKWFCTFPPGLYDTHGAAQAAPFRCTALSCRDCSIPRSAAPWALMQARHALTAPLHATSQGESSSNSSLPPQQPREDVFANKHPSRLLHTAAPPGPCASSRSVISDKCSSGGVGVWGCAASTQHLAAISTQRLGANYGVI